MEQRIFMPVKKMFSMSIFKLTYTTDMERFYFCFRIDIENQDSMSIHFLYLYVFLFSNVKNMSYLKVKLFPGACFLRPSSCTKILEIS